MFIEMGVGAVCVAVGIIIGRKYEQRAVVTALAELATVDQQLRSVVARYYPGLSAAVKAELKKLGI